MLTKKKWLERTAEVRRRLKEEKAARLRYQFGKMIQRIDLQEVETVDALRASDDHALALMEGRQGQDMSFAQLEKLRDVCSEHTVPREIAGAYGLRENTYDDLFAESVQEVWNQDDPQSSDGPE